MPLLKTIIETIKRRHKLSDKADVRMLTLKSEVSEVDNHLFTARVTTDDLDRHGEVVLPTGGILTEFLSTGILAWNHNYDEPVGFPNKTKRIMRSDNFIDIPFRFLERPADWEGPYMPDKARDFVQQALAAGINPGVSIGFMPLETRKPTQKDMERWGKDLEYVYVRWKLLEVSIAPVQANAAAVGVAVGKGIISAKDAVELWGVDAPTLAVSLTLPRPKAIIECALALPKPKAISGEVLLRKALAKRMGRIYL